MATISKITQTSNGNVRFLNSSDDILYQVPSNKVVYLHPNDSEIVLVGTDLIENDINPTAVIRLYPADITHVGGVAFSGDAQDLIDDLDSYFF